MFGPTAAAEPQAAATVQPTEAPSAPAEPSDALAAPTAEPVPTMAVRAGDTLNSLAEWFGISAADIAAYNGITNGDYLQVGQVLAIPVPASVFAVPPEPAVAVAEPEPAPEPLAIAPPEPEPTPPPTPPPAPYIPPSSDAVIAAICSLPWPCDVMVRIAICESGLNPRAVNPAGYYGLFQINYSFPGWDDPLTNATVAYERKYLPALAQGDGLTPWPYCRHA